jgi:ribosomal protein S18 acetylase RimI-like enzyme
MNNIIYSTLESCESCEDGEKVLSSLAQSFSIYEPLNNSLKATPLEIMDCDRPFLCLFKNSTSIVAKDGANGEIVGALLTYDQWKCNKSRDTLQFNYNSKFDPLIHLIEKLECDYFERNPIQQENDCLYIYTLHVDNNYKNLGIAKQLIDKTEQNARNCGYKRMIAVGANQLSQSIFLKKSFCNSNQISYSKFEYKNERPFVELSKREQLCILLEKKII